MTILDTLDFDLLMNIFCTQISDETSTKDGDVTSDTSDSESEEVEAEFKAMHSTELSQSPS